MKTTNNAPNLALEEQLAVYESAMSIALEALQKERQAATGRRDFSMLSIRAIEALESAFDNQLQSQIPSEIQHDAK